MRCEEARRLLRLGSDRLAEAHLADCANCFPALEREDRLAVLLREARPETVVAPERLVGRVISRWQFRRRLPWAVAAAIVVAATIPAAALIWLAANVYTEPALLVQATFAGLLKPFADAGGALLDVTRSRLLDSPEWLTALLALGAASAAAFAVVYRDLGRLQPREAAS